MHEEMLPKEVEPLQPLHTLQTDMAEAVSKASVNKASIITEQEKNRYHDKIEETSLNNAKKDNLSSFKLLRNVFISLISIAIIAASGYGIFKVTNKKKDIPPKEVGSSGDIRKRNGLSLIPYNQSRAVNISIEELSDRSKLVQKILNEAQTENIHITSYELGVPFRTVLSVISPSLPPEYYRAILDEGFFGGTNKGNFFIIQYDSYEQAYAGQLEWEGKMGLEILPMFNINSSSTINSFTDLIVANKDSRAAIDQNGNIIFLYAFYQPNLVVFSKNQEVFKTVNTILQRQNI